MLRLNRCSQNLPKWETSSLFCYWCMKGQSVLHVLTNDGITRNAVHFSGVWWFLPVVFICIFLVIMKLSPFLHILCGSLPLSYLSVRVCLLFLTYSADVSTAGYALQMFFPNLWLVFSFIASYWAKFINLISSILASFYIMVALPVCCLNEPKKSSKNETFPFCKSVFSLASKNLLTVLL